MAARASMDARLDERASATVWAFCKDEGVDVDAALSFIVNDWAALKLAALRGAACDCAAQSAGCSAQTLSATQDAPPLRSAQDAPGGFDSRQEGIKGLPTEA